TRSNGPCTCDRGRRSGWAAWGKSSIGASWGSIPSRRLPVQRRSTGSLDAGSVGVVGLFAIVAAPHLDAHSASGATSITQVGQRCKSRTGGRGDDAFGQATKCPRPGGEPRCRDGGENPWLERSCQ